MLYKTADAKFEFDIRFPIRNKELAESTVA